MVTLAAHCACYVGKSTDKKPANAAPNALYLELDTEKFHYFDPDVNDWLPLGSSENSSDTQGE